MTEQDRVRAYEAQGRKTLTPAQRRRVVHKRGHVAAAALRRDLRPPRVLHLPPPTLRSLTFRAEGGSEVDLTDYVIKVDFP